MSKKSLRKRGDRLWREKVREVWGIRCCICGDLAVDCHHFKAKSGYGHMRYDIDNAVPLCRFHHNQIDKGGKERWDAEEKIKRARGKEWAERIEKKAKEKYNLGGSWKTEEWYKEQIKKLKKL
ncbi:MAG: hypothetical protein ACOC44_18920 [Promethearchaeia archaeon]